VKSILRRSCPVAAAAVIIVAAAACSSAGGQSSDASSASTGGTQGPINLFISTPQTGAVAIPQALAGAEAAVASINKAGGVNGRQIKLITCDMQYDPNLAAACVRKGVQSDAVAMVGSETSMNPATMPTLEHAGMAYLFGESLSPEEDQSSISFPIGGPPAWTYGSAALMKQLGVKHAAVIACDLPTCQQSQQLLSTALDKVGIGLVHSVTAPLTTTDYAPIVAAATAGDVDAVQISTSAAGAAGIITALRQARFQGKIIVSSATVDAVTIGSIGSAANGVYVIGMLAPPSSTSNPEVAQFNSDWKAYDPSLPVKEVGEVTWASVKLIAAVAKNLPTVTRASILKALNDATTSSPINIGVAGSMPMTDGPPLSSLPRTSFNQWVTFEQVKNETLVQLPGGFVNPFQLVDG
jgi:branched-chain amino acid transport system substrate-binding protein